MTITRTYTIGAVALAIILLFSGVAIAQTGAENELLAAKASASDAGVPVEWDGDNPVKSANDTGLPVEMQWDGWDVTKKEALQAELKASANDTTQNSDPAEWNGPSKEGSGSEPNPNDAEFDWSKKGASDSEVSANSTTPNGGTVEWNGPDKEAQ
ncbi:MAG: hypothetical protein Q7S50_03340 [bacterium]|nr:hypothetical protein [bacterium]